MVCKGMNTPDTSFLASTQSSDNYSKSPKLFQPRQGVHSWPAIQYCQRNLKFHPLHPPPTLLPALLPQFASKSLCALLFHKQMNLDTHILASSPPHTGKPTRSAVPANRGFSIQPNLNSTELYWLGWKYRLWPQKDQHELLLKLMDNHNQTDLRILISFLREL